MVIFDIQLLKSVEGQKEIKFFYKTIRSSLDKETFLKNMQFLKRNKKLDSLKFSNLMGEEKFIKIHQLKKVFNCLINNSIFEIYRNKKFQVYKIVGKEKDIDVTEIAEATILLDKEFLINKN